MRGRESERELGGEVSEGAGEMGEKLQFDLVPLSDGSKHGRWSHNDLGLHLAELCALSQVMSSLQVSVSSLIKWKTNSSSLGCDEDHSKTVLGGTCHIMSMLE